MKISHRRCASATMSVGSPVGAGIGAIDAACIAHALELSRNCRRMAAQMFHVKRCYVTD